MSGLIKDIQQLDPSFLPIIIDFFALLKEQNLSFIVVETRRTLAVQKAYFAQGRKQLKIVNDLRREAGLWPISQIENKRRITWTMKSKHIDGIAVDIVPIKERRAWWTAPDDVWEKYGVCGEKLGLVWGGRWGHKDYPHFEKQ